MTQEEKAKAYEMALERANKQRADYQKELDKTDKNTQLAGLLRAGISALEMAFPELKESEGERIRKGLIEALKTAKTVGELKFILPEPIREEYIAYLEKQKDSNDMAFHEGYTCGFEDGMKEQKPAEWSEEDREMIQSIITNGCVDDKQERWLRMLHERIYQSKQEWSEEDEKALERAIDCVRSWEIDYCDSDNKISERLKSFPKRFNLQPKVEWSEEDEKMRELLIAIFEVNYPDSFFKANEIGTTDMRSVHTEEIISWLKSLRSRPKSSDNWKPSEEQMEALLWCTAHLGGADHRVLAELYEHLKKLM